MRIDTVAAPTPAAPLSASATAQHPWLVQSHEQASSPRAERHSVAAALAASLHMLKSVSLNPTEMAYMESLLAKGVADLRFFGVANPVGVFCLPVGCAEHKLLCEAVQANRCSSLYAAAVRTLRHRSMRAVEARSKREDRLMDACRQELSWPTRADYLRDAEHAEAWYRKNVQALNARRRQLRDTRAGRIAVLARAAAPGAADYPALAREIADITRSLSLN